MILLPNKGFQNAMGSGYLPPEDEDKGMSLAPFVVAEEEGLFGLANIRPSTANTLYLTVRSDMFPVNGIDVSRWNSESLENPMRVEVAKPKIQFMIIRAGWGNDQYDAFANYYISECKRLDIPFGLYWFLKAGKDWKKHAQYFAETMDTGPILLVADAEYTELNKTLTNSWMFKYLNELERLTGVRPIIYTNANWWNGHVERNDWAKEYKLWVAHWTLAADPILPWDWGAIHNPVAWTFWQWSGDKNRLGPEYGATGDKDMDLDRYDGTVEKFNEEFGTDIGEIEPPEPPEPPEDEMVDIYTWAEHVDVYLREGGYDGPELDTDIDDSYFVKTNTGSDNLNVRREPDASASIVGKLADGTVVQVFPPEVKADGYTWGRIDSPEEDKWIALDFTVPI